MSKPTTSEIPAGRVIVAGLGNPGAEYEATRHNVGFHVVDLLASRAGVSLTEGRFGGRAATASLAGRDVLLLEPLTFMNRSGQSVGEAARYFKVGAASTVVIHDDLDLPLGKLKLKRGGGHGGHNGLRSIDSHLDGRDYYRVRFGIGRPEHGSPSAWVLGRFSKDERVVVDERVYDAADAVELLLRDGLEVAQRAFHAAT